MRVVDGCQFVNKGVDGICYWWQRTHLGAPGFEWGCFNPNKVQYFIKNRYYKSDASGYFPTEIPYTGKEESPEFVGSEPFMDCKLAEVWLELCEVFKFYMHEKCEGCGSNRFFHPNGNSYIRRCYECGADLGYKS